MTETSAEPVSNEAINNHHEPLIINRSEWSNFYKFEPYQIDGALRDLFTGKIKPDDLTEGNLGQGISSIISQLSKQPFECKTSIALDSNEKLLLQKRPSIGNKDSVNNFFAEPENGGKKVFEIHNHPTAINSEGEKVRYQFFSGGDLGGFAYDNEPHLAEGVVFDGGVAIIIRTPESQAIIDQEKATTKDPDWAWIELSNQLNNQFDQEVPNDTDQERCDFAINFAKKYAMKLIVAPQGSDTFSVIV